MKPLQVIHPHVALDRSSELRNKPAELEKLWESGKIIHLTRQKFLTKNFRPVFLTATEIKNLGPQFIPGLRIFLGMLDGEAFFAFCTDVKSELIEEFDKPTEELIGSVLQVVSSAQYTNDLSKKLNFG